MAEVLLTALAQIHLQGIYARFEELRRGSGDQFSDEVDGAIRLVANNPRLFPPDENGVRRIPVWKSKYGVFWVSEARGIVVVAILFLGEDPRQLRRVIRDALNLP